ncbi:MAG: DUF6647 family protein [Alphaproteobacteria bacterium]
MNELIALMLAWLAASFGLPADVGPPSVRFMTPEALVAIRYGSPNAAGDPDVIALYDDETGTVLLRVGWDGRDVADSSVLVHELVHHVQNVAQLSYPCPAARERLAYEAQARWLALFGHDLDSAFGLDEAMLKLSFVCQP